MGNSRTHVNGLASLMAAQPGAFTESESLSAAEPVRHRNVSGADRESNEILSVEKSGAIKAGLGAVVPLDRGQLECRRSRSKGSRFLEKRIFKTAREWEAERREYAAIICEQRGGRGDPCPAAERPARLTKLAQPPFRAR